MSKITIQRIAFIVGLLFVGVAICGLIPSLTMDKNNMTLLFNSVAVSTVSSILYIITGLVAIGCSLSFKSTERFFRFGGALYGVMIIIGLLQGNTILGLFPIDYGNNILHFLLAIGGVVLGFWPEPHEIITNVNPQTVKDLDSEENPPKKPSA